MWEKWFIIYNYSVKLYVKIAVHIALTCGKINFQMYIYNIWAVQIKENKYVINQVVNAT